MNTTIYPLKLCLIAACLLMPLFAEKISSVSAQCDAEVSGIFTYCNAVGTPGTTGYFVAFRVLDLTGDTLNVVDLDGNNVTNRGKRINDINTQAEPATVTVVPLMISGVGADTLEFWYFGPYANGSTFNIALVDPNNVCDTIFIASGSYDCMDNTAISDPMACDNDVPLYFLDFSQTQFMYGGGGGGNENFDEIFLIMQRSRESFCCDLQPSNQGCFEFIVRLAANDVGLVIDDVGSGATAGEFYADTLNMFMCTGNTNTTWPYTVGGGQSSDLPLCLLEGQEFVVLSCKSGNNVTGVSIDALSSIFAPPQTTIEPCNTIIEVFGADSVMFSSPDDPDLDNLISCTGDSTMCTFLYNTMVFGEVDVCEGDTFTYIVGAMPGGNECLEIDTILFDTTYIVVYPVFTVSIDSVCNATGDSLILTAVVSSPAPGCPYSYLWSNGATSQTITVEFSDTEYFVTVTRSDLPGNLQTCSPVVDSIVANGELMIDCSNLADTLYTCIDQIPEPDTSLVLVSGCANLTTLIFSEDSNNNGSGCIGDTLIITRLYIVDFDGDTITTTTDRDTCTQLLLFVDNIPPVITSGCPANVTVTCASQVPTVNTGFITATDNCDEEVVISHQGDVITNQTCINRFTVIRTYQATDDCGNSATCAQAITVFDNLSPNVTCPANVTVQCASAVPAVNTTSVISSDNCGGSVIITHVSDVNSNVLCANRFTLTRTYRATDACGNSATCAQTITVFDITLPSITCPANTTVQCSSQVPAVNTSSVISTDNCGGSPSISHIGDVITNMTCVNRFTLTRTYQATDACGNTATCAQIITVFDNIPPTLTCPANVTVSCAGNVPPATPGSIPTSDNCGGLVTVTSADVITNMTCANRFTVTRTFTATDACNNTATCAQIITVFDATPPTLTCPGNVTVSCASNVPPANPGILPASDNCGGTVTVTSADVITNMTCLNRFTVVRTFTATDVCGNTATCVQTITVLDNTAPIITCPANITVQCNTQTIPSITGTATATDNCGGTPVITSSDGTITGSCPSTFARTWTATDACGNTATCVQQISFDDTINPVITCPANLTIDCLQSTLPANTGTATATDNCDTAPAVTPADMIIPGGCPQEYTINRTWTATDDCGNTSTCLQTITVDDSTPPVITCPANVTVQCASQVPAVNTGSVTATDNCGIAVVSFISDITINFVCVNRFTVNRTYQATDLCGNSATCVQTITVFDNTPPTLTCPANVTVSCAGNVPPATPGSILTSDNCGGLLTVTSADVITNMTCANRFTVTRTYAATDACNNTATCAQVITVFDATPPTLTCPGNVTVSCASNVPPANPGILPASDNCGGTVTVTSTDVIINMTCTNRFTVARTFTATDVCGNTATCVQTITVFDNTAPAITCPANVTVQCAGQLPPSNTSSVIVNDNCAGVIVVTVSNDIISNMTCANRFNVTRIYTATDACGNSATCAQTLTVFDNTVPAITCPANITVSCASQVPAANPSLVVTSDNCGGTVAVVHVGDVITNMTCINRFTVVRTYQATDVCGNTSTCAQIIIVNDITPPVITCPSNLTINFQDSTDPANTGIATGTDNCAGVPVITSSDITIAGECSQEFTIQRTWTATDECGNSSTCLQVIMLEGGCEIDLSLIKEINPGQGNISGGEDVTFTITVTNDGTEPVGSITITDYIPVGFTLNDPDWTAGNEGSTGQSASIVLSIANGGLPPGGLLGGQSASVEITLQADEDILSGEYINTAEISFVADLEGNDISGDDLDSDPDENDLNDPESEDDHDLVVFCVLPQPVITGDNFVCPGDTVTYSIGAFNPANTYTWILQNGGGIIIDETDSTITIVWQMEPGGAFVIQLTESAGAGCSATTLLLVFIQGDDVLACNDHVNVSIDEDCESIILSGIILEGEQFGDDNYIVIIIDQNGDTIPNATVTIEHVGQTFVVKVMSECSGNSCWGTITVEDKLPPQIVCVCPAENPEPDSACMVTCLDIEQLVNGIIPENLQPEVTDNCGIPTIEIHNTDLNFDNCEGGSILVTWLATDIAGNTSTCVQEFTIIPLTLDSLVFPANYIGECGGSTEPDITGWPQINGYNLTAGGVCNIFTGYWDKELAECGGGRKIVRTWTVLDWCLAEVIEGTQIIKLTDTEGPELTCPPDITVGTDFWYCFANVSIPKPIAHDNCSDVATFEPGAANGDIISFGNNFVINGLVTGAHAVIWTVTDECGNSSTCSFTVTVVDDVVPVANCDQHTIVSLTNDGPGGVTLVPADVFDDGSYDNCGPVTFRARRMDSCIDFDWTTEGACIDHIPGGVPPVNSRDRGTVHRPCVPFACCDVGAGPIMVELEVTDAAGNKNFCMVEAIVQDKISPFIICPPDIIVSCEFWFAVEEGTFTDGEGNNNGMLDEDPLSPVFGNMFDAFQFDDDESVRQDIIINDPANNTISQPHFWGIDGWADDNCEVNLQVRVRIFDDCSGEALPANAPPGAVRLIERRFSASDGNEGIAPGTCTQRIWVVDFEPFFITDINCNNANPNDGVIWPCDITLTTCPEDLGDTGEPTVFDDACSLIGVAFEDTRFNFVDGACFKILRKWSVIDWCQYNPLTGEGLWMFTQVIKVHDHDGPSFLDCPAGPVVLCVADPGVTLPDNNQAFLGEENPLSSSCSAHLNLCETVHETCSDFVKYDVKLYPFNGNEFIQVKARTTVPVDSNNNAVLCFDTRESTIQSIRLNGIQYNSPLCGNFHRILWSVEDDCGNFSFCEYLFRLEDCKQPSPVCINGLSTVVMPLSGQVTIWAKDFDASSFDDCTPSDELLFSFSGDAYQPSFTYACGNTPAFGIELTEHIWVADGGVDHNCNGQIEWSERNKDFCTTTIVILDNYLLCDSIHESLAGEILSSHTDAVSNVTVNLSSPGLTYVDQITGSDGKYTFSNVLPGKDYVISVSRNDEHRNGVSTLDLVRIQKHLLGRELFTDPYQYIAADANNNSHVSAIDLIELRKLILGIYNELPFNSSWRFVDKKFTMADEQNPWPFRDFITIEDLNGSVPDNDFIAVKVGDVNNTAKTNALQILPRGDRRTLIISAVAPRHVEQGEIVTLKLRVPEPLIGLQWTIEAAGLILEKVSSDDILLGDQNVGMLEEGIVTMSWNQEQQENMLEGFTIDLVWKAEHGGDITEMIKLSGRVTEAEAYTPSGEILNVKLAFEGNSVTSEFSLFQNTPNPWKDKTVIGFELPARADATLTVFDVTGKTLKVIEGTYNAGYNTISLASNALPSSGVLYYRLESGEYSATKKMMIIR